MGKGIVYCILYIVDCILVVEIGFVSYFWGGGTLDMQELGSFRVFGSLAPGKESPPAMVIERVSRLWAAALRSAARRSG